MEKVPVAILVGVLIACAIGFGVPLLLGGAGAEFSGWAWGPGFAIGAWVSYILMSLSGNKPEALADEQTRAAALSLLPPSGRGLVIVYREGFLGHATGVDVALDGQEVAQLKSGRFTAISAAPGRHALMATLAGEVNADSKPGDAAFDLAAGEAVVFRITLAMKMTTGDIVLTRIAEPASAVGTLKRMQMVAVAAG